MQNVIFPINFFLTPTKYPQKNTEDNFYEVQTTKCTKTLYQTETIHPVGIFKDCGWVDFILKRLEQKHCWWCRIGYCAASRASLWVV